MNIDKHKKSLTELRRRVDNEWLACQDLDGTWKEAARICDTNESPVNLKNLQSINIRLDRAIVEHHRLKCEFVDASVRLAMELIGAA